MKTTEPSTTTAEQTPAARRLNTRLFAEAAALAWLVAVLVIFIRVSQISYVQFFWWPDLPALVTDLARIAPVRFALDLLRAVAGAAVLALACLSLGLRALQAMKIPRSSPLAYGTTAFVVGEVLLSLLFLSLLSLYRLTPLMVGLALVLALLAGFSPLRTFALGLPRPRLPDEFGRGEKLWLGLVAWVFASGLLLSSARLGYDAVTQYFSHAKIMAVTGQPIYFHPDPFLISSLPPGMLFTALIQLFGDQTARMVPWLNGLAILLLALAIAERAGLSPRSRLLMLTLMITTTAFMDLLGDGKIELIATAPIIAAVYWMLVGLDEPSGNVFALIGLLVGYAMFSRPYNVFLVGLFMALLFAGRSVPRLRVGRLDMKRLFKSALWMVPLLFILGLFYLLQRDIWLNSPAPSVTAAVAAPTGDAMAAGWQWTFDPANLNRYRLFYPFTLTFVSTAQGLGNISPLFVGLLLFALVKNIRKNFHLSINLRLLVLSASITLVLWITLLFAVVEIRYVLFLWVLLYVAVADIVERALASHEKPMRSVTTTLVLALLVYMGTRTALIAVDTYSPVDQNGRAHCYDAPWCTFLDPLNEAAGPGERVLVLNAYRYYLRPDLFACSSRPDEFLALGPLARQDAREFWIEVYRKGFRFVAYESHFAENHTGFGKIPDPRSAPDWLRVSLISDLPQFGHHVFQIEPVDPPFQPELACVPGAGGRWLVQTEP